MEGEGCVLAYVFVFEFPSKIKKQKYEHRAVENSLHGNELLISFSHFFFMSLGILSQFQCARPSSHMRGVHFSWTKNCEIRCPCLTIKRFLGTCIFHTETLVIDFS